MVIKQKAKRGTEDSISPTTTSDVLQVTVSAASAAESTPTDTTSCTTPQRKRSAIEDNQVNTVYVSPLKRVKEAVGQKPAASKLVVRTVDDLKAIIREHQGQPNNPKFASTVILEARVVWTSFDTCDTGPVARLHLIDKMVPETLADMHKILRDRYTSDKMEVDTELATASIYGLDVKAKGIPRDGATITIRRLWGLKLFLGRACQFTTSLDNITVEASM